MAKSFRGKISLDIRDSEPDWEPFLPPKAPEGAPNVLLLSWDDVGYGTMDVFGGPVETPNMRRIADMGVRYANFHTTALCSPTRASLLNGRNATSNGMATIAEFGSGLPRHLRPHPVRERPHLRGPRRARLQHLLRRQVAPDTRRRDDAGVVQGPLAARPRLRALLRVPRRRVEQLVSRTSSTTTTRSTLRACPRTATTSPRTSPTGRSSSSATRRRSTPTSRSSCTSPRRRATRRTTCSRSGPTSTRASSTRATRRSAPRSSSARRSSDCCPRTPSSRRSIPTASRPPPAPTDSHGRCSTRCGRGTR